MKNICSTAFTVALVAIAGILFYLPLIAHAQFAPALLWVPYATGALYLGLAAAVGRSLRPNLIVAWGCIACILVAAALAFMSNYMLYLKVPPILYAASLCAALLIAVGSTMQFARSARAAT